MIRSLKTLAKQSEPLSITVDIQERLPHFIQEPCQVNCEVLVRKERHYYHLSLALKGLIPVVCQRCLHTFNYSFEQSNDIALCFDEERAGQMMSTMDCIVHPEDELDLISIVTDELHLYCPEKHENMEDCDAITYLSSSGIEPN